MLLFQCPYSKESVFSLWPHFSLGEGENWVKTMQQKWPEETEYRCVMQKDAKTEFAQHNKTCPG